MPELTLNLSRKIQAPIKSVFDAWLDPKMLAKFMIPGEGVTVANVDTNPTVGGRFTILMKAGDNDMPHSGEYKTITPYSQIAFTWESARSIDGSVVTLNFTREDGATHIELTQVKFFDEEARSDHQGGWTSILNALTQLLG